MHQRRICFVSFEVAPFTGGGIGTWLRNTLDAYSNRGCLFEVVYCGPQRIDETAFIARFPGVRLHILDIDEPEKGVVEPWQPQRQGGFDSYSLWRSYLLMRLLCKLERETGSFDVIEFVDWAGFAFYALQEKRLGLAFKKSAIAIRLHSSESFLRSLEARDWGIENLIIADLERQSLKYADHIIAHLERVGHHVKEHFGFDAEWHKKVIVETPPVRVGVRKTRTIDVSLDQTPILFTSKFQSFKRPEVFAKGVLAFITSTPHFRGEVIFAAFDTDSLLRERIRSLVPSDRKHRIKYMPALTAETREKLISEGVAVFTSAAESFCYAAYEASLTGAVVVLNENNIAFGDGTPWIDGVNCLKFNGSSRDLKRVLQKIYSPTLVGERNSCIAHGLRPIEVTLSPSPYWETIELHHPATVQARFEDDAPTVTIIVPHRNQGTTLPQLVTSILTETLVRLEIIVVDDASDDPATVAVLSALDGFASTAPHLMRIIRRTAIGGFANMIDDALAYSRSEIVAVFPPTLRPVNGFVRTSVEAIKRDSRIDAIVPCVRVLRQGGGVEAVGHVMPLGASLCTGIFVNRVCNGAFVCPRNTLKRFPMDELLKCEWSWDFIMRIGYAGGEVLVTADAGVEGEGLFASPHVWATEDERREILEVIRRKLSVRGPGGHTALSLIGDGETIRAWYGPADVPPRVVSLDIDAMATELAALKNATSVKVALMLANQISRTVPWARRPLRRYLRKL